MITSARFIVSAIVTGVCLTAVVLAQENITASPERMEQRIKALSEFGANPEGGVSRVAFSDADLAGRAYVSPTNSKAGMIFVPSVDGISHSPKEFTSAEDMANGDSVLLHTVLAVDSGALDATNSE